MFPFLRFRQDFFITVGICCALFILTFVDSAEAQKRSAGKGRSQRTLELFKENHSDLKAKFLASLKKLAETCDAKGLTEAVTQITRIAELSQKENFQTDLLSKQVQPDLPADLSADERFWKTQLRFRQAKYAKELYLLSRRVLHGKFSSYAYEIIREIAHHDPDHRSARRLLGYVRYGDEWVTPVAAAMSRRRFVWHDDFGWLPQSHVDRYERGERQFKSRWISAAKEAELRRDFRNAWEIRTDHYLIKTNHSLERGVALGKALEDFHRFFSQTFAAFFNTPEQMQKLFEGAQNRLGNRKLPKPYEVHYYRSRDEYIDRLKDKIPQIAITNGLYFTGDRVAYFYHDADSDNDSTLFHEATHQLFYESQSRERRIADRANFWIIEGIACYMESFERDGDRFSVGDPNFIRFEAGRYRYLVDRYYVPLEKFTRMGMAAFQTNANISKNYSQASGLSYFFMHYGRGRYRDALIAHLSEIYNVSPRRLDNVTSLDELTGISYDELDRQYGEFTTKLENALAPAGE